MKSEDHLSKSIILRKKENLSQNKIKIKILKEKISSILTRKYNDIFIQKKYNKEQLLKDIEFLTKNVELDDLLFDRLVLEIERIVLMKIIKGRKIEPEDSKSVIRNSKPYVRAVNKSVEIPRHLEETSNLNQTNIQKVQEEYTLQNHIPCGEAKITKNDSNLNSSYSPLVKTGLLEKLQYNQQDDWGLIAKYNYLKEQEDKRLRREKQRSLNSEVFRGLQLQVLEKNKQKKEEAEKEKQYHIQQEKNIKRLKNEEDHKNKKRKENFIKEKEIRDSLFLMNTEKRKMEKEKELVQDKIFIESVRKGLLVDENVKKEKKEREKLFNKEIVDDVEKNINEKNQLRDKERLEMRREFKEYYNQMEKKEKERDLIEKIKKDKMKAHISRYDHVISIKEIEKKNELVNNEKIEKERLRLEYEELEKTKLEKEKKENMRKELFHSLNKQIEDKKNKQMTEKKIEEEFDKEVLKDVEDYRKKQTEKDNLMRLTFTKHKEVLKRQLEEKSLLNKVNHKDEKEYILSRDLIKSIKSSPLIQKVGQF